MTAPARLRCIAKTDTRGPKEVREQYEAELKEACEVLGGAQLQERLVGSDGTS